MAQPTVPDITQGLESWDADIRNGLRRITGSVLQRDGTVLGPVGGCPLPVYTVATLPDAAANQHSVVIVTDHGSEGLTLAISTGSAWEYFTKV